ncbi:MAG: hypothetical protein FGM33_09180, partial [Candidatus Kapabacteria bacterium]|nr:hypothetical protein [Candidatus Kapabacteria bacterium]
MNRFYTVLLRVFVLVAMFGAGSELSAQYCRPTLAPGWWGNGITFFRFGTFSRSSATSDFNNQTGYEYFTTTALTAFRGTPIDVTINSNTFGTQIFAMWIDLDQDGIFQPEERIFCDIYTAFGQGAVNRQIILNCAARSGRTRLRIMCQTNTATCPNDPCVFPGAVGGECEDYNLDIIGGFVSSFPNDTPDSSAILPRGNIYDGSTANRPMPSVSIRAGLPGAQTVLRYRIFGPAPLTDTVYSADWTAVAPTSGVFPQTFTSSPSVATGRLAGAGASLNTTNAVGGEYILLIRSIPSGNSCADEYSRAFTIAVNRDMSTRQLRSPTTNEAPRKFKYPNTTPIPVEAVFQNSGLDTVKQFRGIVRLFDPSGNLEYVDTANINEATPPAVRLTQTFENFNPQGGGHPVGLHRGTACAELIDPFPDENTFNDCLPRPGATPIVFEIGYNEEPAVNSVVVPSLTAASYLQTLIQGRSFRPEAVFENNGIQDLSNVPVRLIITRLPNTQVYNQTGIVPDIAAGQFNKAIYTFPSFTPVEAGDYRFCFRVEYPGDPVLTNNELCATRTVEPNLNGTYTIGTTVQGPRNFPTIDSALNVLYFRGVSGPVVFEFTDASYTVTKVGVTTPAIDLSSRIIGASAVNTITFRPTIERSIAKGAVTINMVTESGVGVLFGQNAAPSNSYAIQRQNYYSNATNANSAGYITFDGGLQKAIRFTMRKNAVPGFPSPFVSVFYLSSGSSNINVRNLLIENAIGVTPSYADSLPQVQFNSGSNQFRFEGNTRNNSISYTAGITQRDTVNPDNLGNLDTLINTNNKFIGNEINGFGYGVVSIGIGSLIKGGINEFRPYYNQGTEIRDNLIFNVRRAGIFSAYEDGIQIVGNRIYNVGAATGGTPRDVAGIMAGGEQRYNNMNLFIAQNEISGVSGNIWSRGITVQQARNEYQTVTGMNKGFGPRSQGVVFFPNRAERTYVTSNAIWGLTRGTNTANVAGVHVFTTRATSASPVTALLTPNNVNYFMQGDSIVNNTIVIDNESFSLSGVTTGATVGIGVQNSNGPVIMNNAIALNTMSNPNAITTSAIFY